MDRGSLLARCQEGEQVAWKELYVGYARSIHRWATYFGLDPSCADEVTQEVFVTAVLKIGHCRTDKELSSWLFQITRRLAANTRRLVWVTRMVGLHSGTDDHGRTDAKPAPEPDLALDLRRLLARLPVSLVEILILHDLDGRSRSEISSMLRMPEGKVARRLTKARSELERLWAAEEVR